MDRRSSSTMSLLAVVAVVAALSLAAVPALAHHKGGHAQGSSQTQDDGADEKDKGGAGTKKDGDAYTEDNDTNDGNTPNNVSDEGDNAHPSGKDRSVENGSSGNQGNSESDPDDDGRGPDRSNGGPDKPNGSGGVDKADQDGNNGCGNDDDFEDDNEGWCGRKPKPAKPEVKPAGPCDADATMPGTQPCTKGDVEDKPCDADATMPGTQPCLDGGVLPAEPCVDDAAMGAAGRPCEEEDEPDVLGYVITRPATPEHDVEEGPEVLGERLSQPVEDGGMVEAAERGAAFLGRQLPFTGSALLSFAAIAVGLLLAGAGILATRRSV